MSEKQPPTVVEGATAGDFEDEVETTAKSAEDRKAASALANLDGKEDDAGPAKEVDQEAVDKAMKSLASGGAKAAPKKEVKNVKVDQKDVALLVRPWLPLPAGPGTWLRSEQKKPDGLDAD
jgi:hypothetical protein